MKIKEGVIFLDPHPAILYAIGVVDVYWRQKFGRQATITAASDGTHSENSYHYGVAGDPRCRAVDFRTRDLTGAQKAQAQADLRRLLGTMFDVVLETTHLHLEFEMRNLEAYR